MKFVDLLVLDCCVAVWQSQNCNYNHHGYSARLATPCNVIQYVALYYHYHVLPRFSVYYDVHLGKNVRPLRDDGMVFFCGESQPWAKGRHYFWRMSHATQSSICLSRPSNCLCLRYIEERTSHWSVSCVWKRRWSERERERRKKNQLPELNLYNSFSSSSSSQSCCYSWSY